MCHVDVCAKDKHKQKFPFETKAYLGQAKKEKDPARHALLKKKAWAAMHTTIKLQKCQALGCKVKAGQAIWKSALLKPIEAIDKDGEKINQDAAKLDLIVEFFEKKWRCDNIHEKAVKEADHRKQWSELWMVEQECVRSLRVHKGLLLHRGRQYMHECLEHLAQVRRDHPLSIP